MVGKLNHRGFSLAETLVTVFIFSLLAAGLWAITLAGERSWQANRTKVELQQDMRKAMEAMINELREAGPASISNVPANNTAYTTITFQIPSGVSFGQVTWDPNSIQYVLGGSPATQLRRVSGGTTKVLANNVQSLQFQRFSADPERMLVTMQGQKNTVKGDAVGYNLAFEIQLRN